MSSALAGRFLTTGPAGKSPSLVNFQGIFEHLLGVRLREGNKDGVNAISALKEVLVKW